MQSVLLDKEKRVFDVSLKYSTFHKWAIAHCCLTFNVTRKNNNKCLRHFTSKVLTTTHLLKMYSSQLIYVHYADGFCWHLCRHSRHWPLCGQVLLVVVASFPLI